MMQKGFDAAAKQYDEVFSTGFYAIHARKLIYSMIQPVLQTRRCRILELNAGTGVDALYFLQHGHEVCITDASEGMLNQVRHKVQSMFPKQFQIQRLDLKNYRSGYFQPDLVFSNFGGLNCLSPEELHRLFFELNKDLKKGSRLCLTLMPAFSLPESLYFLLRGKFKSIFRRRHSPVEINVHQATINTWFYSPAKLQSTFPERWKIKRKIALGFFLPPPFLDRYAKRLSIFFNLLFFLEKTFQSFPGLSSVSDHNSLLIEVE